MKSSYGDVSGDIACTCIYQNQQPNMDYGKRDEKYNSTMIHVVQERLLFENCEYENIVFK